MVTSTWGRAEILQEAKRSGLSIQDALTTISAQVVEARRQDPQWMERIVNAIPHVRLLDASIGSFEIRLPYTTFRGFIRPYEGKWAILYASLEGKRRSKAGRWYYQEIVNRVNVF